MIRHKHPYAEEAQSDPRWADSLRPDTDDDTFAHKARIVAACVGAAVLIVGAGVVVAVW